mmetsp:Transcript_6038/g.13342  ORF Transcript_6038/g.13342 Transcript_6038/m.13342 type:complete len:272 (-) Transcript_6038:698-1513(-)
MVDELLGQGHPLYTHYTHPCTGRGARGQGRAAENVEIQRPVPGRRVHSWASKFGHLHDRAPAEPACKGRGAHQPAPVLVSPPHQRQTLLCRHAPPLRGLQRPIHAPHPHLNGFGALGELHATQRDGTCKPGAGAVGRGSRARGRPAGGLGATPTNKASTTPKAPTAPTDNAEPTAATPSAREATAHRKLEPQPGTRAFAGAGAGAGARAGSGRSVRCSGRDLLAGPRPPLSPRFGRVDGAHAQPAGPQRRVLSGAAHRLPPAPHQLLSQVP